MAELGTTQQILVFLFALALTETLSKAPRHFSWATHLFGDASHGRRAVLRFFVSFLFFAGLPLSTFGLVLGVAPSRELTPLSIESVLAWIALWGPAFLIPGGYYRIFVGLLLLDKEKRAYTFPDEWDEKKDGWCWKKQSTGGRAISHLYGGIFFIGLAFATLAVTLYASS